MFSELFRKNPRFTGMKLKLLIPVFGMALFIAQNGFAQDDQQLKTAGEEENISQPAEKQSAPVLLLKPQWNVSIGSNTFFSAQTGTFSGLSVTPYLSLPLSERISVFGGASFTRFLSPVPMLNDFSGNNATTGMITVFGTATYRLNDHILLYGTGTKHFGTLPMPGLFPVYNPDNLTVGSMFKLGDHFTIGASVRMSGHSSYNPYYPYSLYDPMNVAPGPFTTWP
jgi:hypothetical protein